MKAGADARGRYPRETARDANAAQRPFPPERQGGVLLAPRRPCAAPSCRLCGEAALAGTGGRDGGRRQKDAPARDCQTRRRTGRRPLLGPAMARACPVGGKAGRKNSPRIPVKIFYAPPSRAIPIPAEWPLPYPYTCPPCLLLPVCAAFAGLLGPRGYIPGTPAPFCPSAASCASRGLSPARKRGGWAGPCRNTAPPKQSRKP